MIVLRPGALGDTLLAVPALRALRRTYGSISLFAHGPTAHLLAQLGEVHSGRAFDDPSLAWVFRNEPAPDATIAWMSQPVRGALLAAPSRPAGEQHVATYLLETLARLGIAREFDAAPLRVKPTVSSDVLVHVGSGSPAKNWSAACFAEVIARLENVRLIVGEADSAAAHEVETSLGKSLPRVEHASLEELATRLAGCRAYIGNDSGVSHLAGLCGARTVALFGPTSPVLWQPLGPQVRVLPFEARVEDVLSAVAA